jgi:hypothetical protein
MLRFGGLPADSPTRPYPPLTLFPCVLCHGCVSLGVDGLSQRVGSGEERRVAGHAGLGFVPILFVKAIPTPHRARVDQR